MAEAKSGLDIGDYFSWPEGMMYVEPNSERHKREDRNPYNMGYIEGYEGTKYWRIGGDKEAEEHLAGWIDGKGDREAHDSDH